MLNRAEEIRYSDSHTEINLVEFKKEFLLSETKFNQILDFPDILKYKRAELLAEAKKALDSGKYFNNSYSFLVDGYSPEMQDYDRLTHEKNLYSKDRRYQNFLYHNGSLRLAKLVTELDLVAEQKFIRDWAIDRAREGIKNFDDEKINDYCFDSHFLDLQFFTVCYNIYSHLKKELRDLALMILIKAVAGKKHSLKNILIFIYVITPLRIFSHPIIQELLTKLAKEIGAKEINKKEHDESSGEICFFLHIIQASKLKFSFTNQKSNVLLMLSNQNILLNPSVIKILDEMQILKDPQILKAVRTHSTYLNNEIPFISSQFPEWLKEQWNNPQLLESKNDSEEYLSPTSNELLKKLGFFDRALEDKSSMKILPVDRELFTKVDAGHIDSSIKNLNKKILSLRNFIAKNKECAPDALLPLTNELWTTLHHATIAISNHEQRIATLTKIKEGRFITEKELALLFRMNCFGYIDWRPYSIQAEEFSKIEPVLSKSYGGLLWLCAKSLGEKLSEDQILSLPKDIQEPVQMAKLFI